MKLFFIFYFLILSYSFNSQTLRLSISIFRHGSREPLIIDPEGKLTDSGKAMEYLLGKEIRTRYVIQQENFLPINYDKDQIYIQSSPVERSIESLKWVLSGLYQDQDFDPNIVPIIKLNFTFNEKPPINLDEKLTIPKEQIIYQHSQAFNDIKLSSESLDVDSFYHSHSICPNLKQEIQMQDKSDRYKIKNQEHSDTWFQAREKLHQIIGFNYFEESEHPKLKSIGKIYDYYICELYKGQKEKLNIFSGELLQKILIAKNDYINIKFQNDFVKKQAVSDHFQEILYFLDSILVRKENKKKFLIYSCHDRNIYFILVNLMEQEDFYQLGDIALYQPFGSVLFFDFWEVQEEDIEVQLKYNDIPIKMKCSTGSQYKCKFKDFTNLLNSIIQNQQTCYQNL